MSGYSRQSLADIVATEVIKAAPINAEFNALRDAFIVASGHKHDGTAEEGAYVPLISDSDAYNKVVIDSGNNRVQFFVEVSSAAAEQLRLQDGVLVPVTDNDIDLGTSGVEFKDLYLDGTAKIDTLTVDENATVAGTLNVTGNVTLTADLTINGNTTIGDAATDTVTVTADVASPLIPSADDTYDIGAVGSEWRNLYIDGTANIDSLVADTADINAGTIDGTTIGGNSAAAGSFTTLSASSNATVTGTLAVTGAATFSNNVTVNGNTTVGDANTDTATFNARIASALVPSTDDARDLGTSALEWRDLYIDGTANIDSLVADTADINGGTIDGAVIGGGTAAAITGTTITANTNFVGNITGNVTSSGTSSFATVTTSGNVTIGGDLTVNGTTTTVSTTNTVIEDALIEIGNGTTGAPANDAGIVIERGSENNAFIGFDESADKFIVGTGTFTGASTGDLTITTGTLVANIEGNVTGNVTGNLTGNVTATTGTSSFATVDFDDITDGTITITGFVDEDDMASNSATLLPTQQSVKKYVDDEILNNYNVFGLTATGAELNVLDGDTSPASVTLVGTDGFPVNDAGVTKLALISDIADYIESVTLTSATLANPTVSGLYLSDSGFVVEGSSADANETTVIFTNPTADNTITFPDATGIVFLTDGSGNVDINGGTIDGTTIGGASAAAGTFTNLEANGTIKLDGNYPVGTANVALGDAALDDAGLTGGNNTAVGSCALSANTTGASNTAFGVSALLNNTTGSNNTASGVSAMNANTTGSANTAFGRSAMVCNTTGGSNSALGCGALFSNTTGGSNVAIGFTSMCCNTTGTFNTAVGANALLCNVEGDQSTALGADALRNQNPVGNADMNNVAVGYQAALCTTTGCNSTAIGACALRSNTTGSFNAASGRQALFSNTTGCFNTAVGVNALFSNTTASLNNAFGNGSLFCNTTGCNNTAVSNAALCSNTTGNFNVAVGNSALSANVEGDQSTALGYEALRNQNPSGNADMNNVAVGFQAALCTTTGVNNTAVGAASLQQNTTGANNGAFGLSALGANTTGGSNTGVGLSSLRCNTTGCFNTAMGVNALRLNVAGDQSVAIGYEALSSQNPVGNADMNNVAVGYQAALCTTTGANNTAVGARALLGNTTGCENSAFGRDALLCNTTGILNAAMGRDALCSNTTGIANIAVGNSALRLNVEGDQSVAIGHQALTAQNPVGNADMNNVAVGYQAALCTTTGAGNTAVGACALRLNTTGGNNAAFGREALRSNTTGGNNTASGLQALLSNTTGCNNAAYGVLALCSNTTGAGNTAVGINALCTATTADFNTAIGNSALASVTGENNTAFGAGSLRNATTGCNNIGIGRDAGRSGGTFTEICNITTESNYIVMGNDAHTCALIKVAWTATSDCRDKTCFRPIEHGLDFVRALKPTEYQFRKGRESDETDGKRRYGFLAQEVLPLEGDNPVIISADNPDKLQYTEAHLIPVLVKAIQELTQEVDRLRAEVETLKNA